MTEFAFNRNLNRTIIAALRLVVVFEINRNETIGPTGFAVVSSGDDIQRMQLSSERYLIPTHMPA